MQRLNVNFLEGKAFLMKKGKRSSEVNHEMNTISWAHLSLLISHFVNEEAGAEKDWIKQLEPDTKIMS